MKARTARSGVEYTDTIYGLAGDGGMRVEGVSLSSYGDAEYEAETATSADSMDTTSTSITVSRTSHRAGNYYHYIIDRGYLYFDTSAIPTGATILSAVASVYVTFWMSSTAKTLQAYDGQRDYPTSNGTTPALALTDWDKDEYALADSTAFQESEGGGIDHPNEYWAICDVTSIVTPGGLTKFML